jgi:Purine nucleoside phosphorylase
MEKIKIGIIGGSGLYQMPELQNVREMPVDTPFGKPSDAFIVGELEGVEVAFLPRHGRGHRLLPTELPFRVISTRRSCSGSSTYCRYPPSDRCRKNMRRRTWSFPTSSLTALAHEQRSQLFLERVSSATSRLPTRFATS